MIATINGEGHELIIRAFWTYHPFLCLYLISGVTLTLTTEKDWEKFSKLVVEMKFTEMVRNLVMVVCNLAMVAMKLSL